MEDDYHFGTRRFIIMRNNVLNFNTRDALKDQRGDWLDPEAKKEFYSWTPEEKITKKKNASAGLSKMTAGSSKIKTPWKYYGTMQVHGLMRRPRNNTKAEISKNY